jgi:hypothetical protein
MAATKTGSTSATSHAASLYDSHSRASGSHYSSSEAADYADADYDGFNMNGMAGPSHYDGFGVNASAGPSTFGDDVDFTELNGFASSIGNPFKTV